MSALPLVTIAIPTFNRAAGFFPVSLTSACAQTYPNLDIFVSDNSSVDDTKARVEAFADRRVRYHRHPVNVGPSRNMNFCVEQARGDYLVILPDDDFLDDDFVESCVKLAVENPQAGLVRTGTRVVDATGRLLSERPNQASGVTFDDLVISWITGTTSPYQCSIMFRAKPLQSIGLHSRHYLFDDVVSFFKIASEHGFIDIEETKASFRLHAGELTSKADIEAWCEESMDLLDLLCELSPANSTFIRTRGLQFLAVSNYRRALRRPFPQSLLACLTVLRSHHFALPSGRQLARAVSRRLRRNLRGR